MYGLPLVCLLVAILTAIVLLRGGRMPLMSGDVRDELGYDHRKLGPGSRLFRLSSLTNSLLVLDRHTHRQSGPSPQRTHPGIAAAAWT